MMDLPLKVVLPEHNLVLDPENRERIELKITDGAGTNISLQSIYTSMQDLMDEERLEAIGLKGCTLMGTILCQVIDPVTAAMAIMSKETTTAVFVMGALWGRLTKNQDISIEVIEGTMTDEDDRLIEEAMKESDDF